MAILQGSSYKLPIRVVGLNGVVVSDVMVEKGVFTIGGLEKSYGDGGEVWYDSEKQAWILPLSEKETFGLKDVVDWQVRFLMVSGEVTGTVPKGEYVYDSIIKVELSGGGDDVRE